jgi:hypothetical protein
VQQDATIQDISYTSTDEMAIVTWSVNSELGRKPKHLQAGIQNKSAGLHIQLLGTAAGLVGTA